MNLARKAEVVSARQIALSTVEITIKPAEIFTFSAGQYIWLMLPELKYPDRRGDTRMFSVSSSPNKKDSIEIIFRMSGSGYKRTLAEMKPGAGVVFSGPYGSLRLPEAGSTPVFFIAGGVGIAPLLSMIRFSSESGSGRRIKLLYANGGNGASMYLKELQELEKKNPDFQFSIVSGKLKPDHLKNAMGDLINQRTHWYVIGPQTMVDFAGKYLFSQGVLAEDMFFEQFYPDLPA